MLCCAALRPTMPYKGRLCHSLLCYAMLSWLCNAMQCNAMLCYAMQCYSMLSKRLFASVVSSPNFDRSNFQIYTKSLKIPKTKIGIPRNLLLDCWLFFAGLSTSWQFSLFIKFNFTSLCKLSLVLCSTETKTATTTHQKIIYGLVGLLILLVASIVCYIVFKRLVF